MNINPKYLRSSYGGECETLNNGKLKLNIFKRLSGWGWGEIYTPDGKLMGILDYLGEILLRDQEIPMRLEAEIYTRKESQDGIALIFDVSTTQVTDKLKGTSFEPWVHFPFVEKCVEGTVTITLKKDEPLLIISYDLVSNVNLYLRYFRGPWLKVGEGSFETQKSDAIFPGIEWLVGKEWSSGSDWFKDPWALRVIPHPYKVTVPVMAVSHEGDGIGLSWDPNRSATRWFNYRENYLQPVFACPNFVERMNNNLLGLMLPNVETEAEENKPFADIPMELHIGQIIRFDAEIFVCKGNSLDVVMDWVRRRGMPKASAPRWSLEEALHHIANAYNTNLWHEGQGFGIKQRYNDRIVPSVPYFMNRYIEENKGSAVANSLKEKLDWCKRQITGQEGGRLHRFLVNLTAGVEELEKQGQQLLSYQNADGSFSFDPEGLHYVKDDFLVARSFIEPMGICGDAALHICIVPAFDLIQIYKATGNEAFLDAAKKTFEFCMDMTRPEGGDYWETPLHAPNLLAAGIAANAYYYAYQILGDERYKQKAIYWLRSLIPFTHLWQPEKVQLLYNTKPCLCSSDWYFANWVRDHVQWEVLETFCVSGILGIDWAEVDPEFDWTTFHEGITTAVFRWMVDHTDNNWRPHNIPESYELYLRGEYDCCFADTHNSVTGNYGGALIMPDMVAENIYYVLDEKKRR